MEIKLNKDLQKMESNVYMGLTGRQAIFSGISLVLGAGTFLLSSSKGISSDIASILTSLVVVPFAALGFVKYNGLNFEQLVKVWLQQYVMTPKVLLLKLENYYYELDKNKIKKSERDEVLK